MGDGRTRCELEFVPVQLSAFIVSITCIVLYGLGHISTSGQLNLELLLLVVRGLNEIAHSKFSSDDLVHHSSMAIAYVAVTFRYHLHGWILVHMQGVHFCFGAYYVHKLITAMAKRQKDESAAKRMDSARTLAYDTFRFLWLFCVGYRVALLTTQAFVQAVGEQPQWGASAIMIFFAPIIGSLDLYWTKYFISTEEWGRSSGKPPRHTWKDVFEDVGGSVTTWSGIVAAVIVGSSSHAAVS
mmetsp:Transcript_3477/g.6929  ORF Transcript_3477/g.6929 Transcript_3477/m.6929 type:complete len:241 (+) Transcript_3477:31-753(+)